MGKVHNEIRASAINISPLCRKKGRKDSRCTSRKRTGAVSMDCQDWQNREVKYEGSNMKRRRTALLLLLCSVTVFARVGRAKADKVPSEFEQTLMTAEKGFIDAAKKGDVAFFKHALTDDFSFVSFDGQLYNRQEMLDQYGQPGTDILPYEMKVVPAGEGVAIVTYNVVYRVPAAEDQGPPPRYQHFTTVWVKQGDAWKMKFHQMTAAHWGDW